MADVEYNAEEAAGTCQMALLISLAEKEECSLVDLLGYVDGWDEEKIKRKRAFRKFSYRGIDLDQLLDLSSEQLRDVVHARARRRFNRGLKRKPMGLIKKLRKAKQEAKPNEKPDLVKTHLRDMIVVPEMIGSVIGIYSGKEFNQVEIKPEMVGHYLAEFSISYKPVKHGRPGIGATHSSRFIPLK
ncbi:40S ribosomal protein S15 [Trichophyton tonsurans CBS 112818]|uniref:40S ribosomal protein S15 n=1 Tax=Trichophyton tonsurans (strain CBS 112818) TaxID=647933 RepID=F2RXI9_TRIT1|nr:40S ribosomal protein S15 [Trichophyton tonsurans CBS 112818]